MYVRFQPERFTYTLAWLHDLQVILYDRGVVIRFSRDLQIGYTNNFELILDILFLCTFDDELTSLKFRVF